MRSSDTDVLNDNTTHIMCSRYVSYLLSWWFAKQIITQRSLVCYSWPYNMLYKNLHASAFDNSGCSDIIGRKRNHVSVLRVSFQAVTASIRINWKIGRCPGFLGNIRTHRSMRWRSRTLATKRYIIWRGGMRMLPSRITVTIKCLLW